jgi:hypothetical protein
VTDAARRYPWARLVYSLGERPPYRDRHGWVSRELGGALTAAPLETYQDQPVIVLLGERGVGKSDVLLVEAARLKADGADQYFLDLPRLRTDDRSAQKLAAALGLEQDGGPPRFVLLDNLDEAIDNGPGAWELLPGFLDDLGAEGRSRLRLRIACRSSRFPASFRAELDAMWPGHVRYLGVAGLTRADVVIAAECNGLDTALVDQLERRRLVPLASWPVTLNPLLAAAAQGSPLPENAEQAFAQACERLCTETNPGRRDAIRSGHPSAADLLAAGRRLAAAFQFGEGDTLAELPEDGPGLPLVTLARGNEPDGAGRQVPCTEHLLRKLTESALMSALGPRRWGFCHHSFQEFLAAQYVEAHRFSKQVRRSILMAGQGSSRHVIASQREVAAWLATSDTGLFEEILACDPEALLLADPGTLPAAGRHRLAGTLLDLARKDFTVQLDPLLLHRLDHPELAAQLAPHLSAGRPLNELYATLLIARACPQPALTSQLLALAEDAGIPENLRSLAVQAVTIDSDQTASRLLQITAGGPADLGGAVLARLWPGHMTTQQMLSRLPQPHPNRLAAGWSFMHALPRMLQPADLPDALAWASSAMPPQGGREHVTLSIKVLAWAVRTGEPLDGGHPALADLDGITVKVAEALVRLARSEYFHEAGMPFEELGGELTSRPLLRRSVARSVLEQASVQEAGDLAYNDALSLFPREDTAYWAEQLPALPPGTSGKLRFALRSAPEDREEWDRVWELAQADEVIREATSHWYRLPTNHPLAADARRSRERGDQDRARRAAIRYDEAALAARLAMLISGQVPARQGWAEVVIDLHRTAAGDNTEFDHRLDLSLAPSFPPPVSELHERLIAAAAAVLRDASLITADQIDPSRINLFVVPELWALSVLIQAGRPTPSELDTPRWAGLTLALTLIPAPPGDRDLHSRLLAVGLRHSGSVVEESIPALLDPLSRPWLTRILGGLMPVRTPGLTVRLLSWAQHPDRDLGQREAVLDALAGDGDQDVLQSLRETIPLAGHEHGTLPSSSGSQWVSDALILAWHDTAASLPAIVTAAADASGGLARSFLERLATDTGLGEWPMDLSVLAVRDLADLYDLIAVHGPPGNVPLFNEHGTGLYGPGQQLERMRRQLTALIANQRTPEAADQVHALATRYPDHWQLRELARQLPRDVAAQSWQPLGTQDLLALADDTTLRLVHDQRQLSDVVTESLTRFQHLLQMSNGWVTLLWNRENDKASTGWWPAWEQDLSDMVATFLKHDLEERQIIVNREVQIIRPGLNGQRTDIHVQARALSTDPQLEPLTVIIESKGCWNPDLDTDLSAQLVGKYLATPGRHAGIYLVGYFDNPRWNPNKNPGRRPHTAHTLDSVTDSQTRIAREQAEQKSVTITAFVLDCRLAAPPEDKKPQ